MKSLVVSHQEIRRQIEILKVGTATKKTYHHQDISNFLIVIQISKSLEHQKTFTCKG